MWGSVPPRCPPVLPCRPTRSARSSSNGCVPGPFGADRYLTAREDVIRRPAGTLDGRIGVAFFTQMHCWGLPTGETRLLRPAHVPLRDQNLDVVSAKGNSSR